MALAVQQITSIYKVAHRHAGGLKSGEQSLVTWCYGHISTSIQTNKLSNLTLKALNFDVL